MGTVASDAQSIPQVLQELIADLRADAVAAEGNASPWMQNLDTIGSVRHAILFCANRVEAAVRAIPLPSPQWLPIETAPKEDVALFWVVPKTPDESYVNTSGDPIFGDHKPYIHKGKSKTWSSLSKATHWMPLPAPPTGAAPQPEVQATNGLGDPCCEHGTALDVHCCNCHSGFIFEKDHVCHEPGSMRIVSVPTQGDSLPTTKEGDASELHAATSDPANAGLRSVASADTDSTSVSASPAAASPEALDLEPIRHRGDLVQAVKDIRACTTLADATDLAARLLHRGFIVGQREQARVPQPPVDLLYHPSVKIAFESGWSAGFQEALTPDEHPDQDRCEVAFTDWQREVEQAGLPASDASPSKEQEETKNDLTRVEGQ